MVGEKERLLDCMTIVDAVTGKEQRKIQLVSKDFYAGKIM